MICEQRRIYAAGDRLGLVTWLGLFAMLAPAAALTAPAETSAETTANSSPEPWTAARPDYSWSFPEDHWSHPGTKTEWWYFTGHLRAEDDPQQRFGFQFTFFRIGLVTDAPMTASAWTAQNLVMGHASVTDLKAGKHVFSEILYREIPLLGGFGVYPDSSVAWSRGPGGTDSLWTLIWDGQGFHVAMADDHQQVSFSLSVMPTRSLVFQGPNGYSRKGCQQSAASQYYSFTRLETRGTLQIGGRSFAVQGLSWMDREFGSHQLGANQVGWDWFSLQLADGRDLMLYQLRDRQGGVDFARGTLVSAAGEARYLKIGDWQLETTARWRSSQTGAEYPARWRLSVPDAALDVEIRPLLSQQENVSRRSGGLHYWEGAVSVQCPGAAADSKPLGQGYVELTGYGDRNRPPI